MQITYFSSHCSQVTFSKYQFPLRFLGAIFLDCVLWWFFVAYFYFLGEYIPESRDNFKIAFMMFDDDDSGRVDKEEFLLVWLVNIIIDI